jgi:hypothetical protein
VTLTGAVVVGPLWLRLHGGESRSVLERQVADGRQVQLVGSQWAQARRVRGSSQRSVVRSRRERVVREGRRRRSSRVRRVRAGALHTMPVSIVVIIGVRSSHVLRDRVGGE